MNIELHGFDPRYVDLIIDGIWLKLSVSSHTNHRDLDLTDCVVTIVQSESLCVDGSRMPFVRIYSDEESDFDVVVEFLKQSVRIPGAGSRTYVECVLLHKCVEL